MVLILVPLGWDVGLEFGCVFQHDHDHDPDPDPIVLSYLYYIVFPYADGSIPFSVNSRPIHEISFACLSPCASSITSLPGKLACPWLCGEHSRNCHDKRFGTLSTGFDPLGLQRTIVCIKSLCNILSNPIILNPVISTPLSRPFSIEIQLPGIRS
jgi:hypothetical protein